MRKQLLGVFLPLLVMVLFAAAETQSTGTEASPHAALQKVSVVRGQDGISVEITARGQVAPQLSTLDRPERVVLDLPNTVMATAQSHISVDSEGVKGVRVGMDGQKPPTTRVVVDLEQACRYELVPGSDHKLVLKLRPAAAQAAKKPAKAPVVTAAVAPARLVVKKEVATARPEAVPAPAVVVPAAESKPAASASSATDYVFVEPSYKPKDATATAENKPATIAPPARVM
jgi:hypothetical protein